MLQVKVVPASIFVVNRILENAIDAGATEIQLIVKMARKTLNSNRRQWQGYEWYRCAAEVLNACYIKIQKAEDLFNLPYKGL